MALNFNSRRDIYAAITLLRDLFAGDSTFSRLGRTYQETNPTWRALEKNEFTKLYKPAGPSDKFSPGLKQVTIAGELVTEFSN